MRIAILDKLRWHLPEFEIALHTGMRRSEQYGLTWDNVDLDERRITVPQSKNGEVRYVRLNSKALAILRGLQERSGGLGPVFIDEDGQAITTPRRWFEPAVINAKLRDFTWHCIRHTFASRLIMKGANLREVQEAMGHKTIQMTCRYAHLAPAHQLAVVERLCENGALETSTGTTTGTNAPAPDGAAAVVAA